MFVQSLSLGILHIIHESPIQLTCFSVLGLCEPRRDIRAAIIYLQVANGYLGTHKLYFRVATLILVLF